MNSTDIVAELPWLWSGLAAYALATFVAIWGVVPRHQIGMNNIGGINEAGNSNTSGNQHERLILALLVSALIFLTIAIAMRWVRIGHGPWISLFELLMSQLLSLGVIFTLAYWRLPGLRASAVIALPILWILGTWVLLLEPKASHFPATYYNQWKWAHVLLGKVYLALLLLGVGLSGVMILRQFKRTVVYFERMPANEILDKIAWRFMMLALVFDSLMLIAGAVWAQDAWGRYWSWDPLETSAFLTWLALALGLHLRLTYRIPAWLSGAMIIGIFILAFTTYFGVPYLSASAHKGMV